MLGRISIRQWVPGVVAAVAITIACSSAPPKHESTAPDVDWLCDKHSDIVTRLFDGIDLGRAGLEQTKAAVAGEDWPAACTELVAYYRTCPSGSWLRRPVQTTVEEATDSLSEKILDDSFSIYSVEAKVPRKEDGGLDWTYNGPEGDREWGWSLNRHFSLQTLLEGYSKTGNTSYVLRLDDMVRDWVIASPYPGVESRTPQWRGLEVSARVRQWDDVFYGLQDVEEFSPTARIMMLSSLLDHADYLRNFHAGRGNWVANEMKGLAAVAVSWPEFSDAPEWIEYANERMSSEITAQVYPDGAQKELTIPYHRGTLQHFQDFIYSLEHGGVPVEPALPDGVERMWNYLAYTLRPNGYGPMNNDTGYVPVGKNVERAARRRGREDWTYIATRGTSGNKPQHPSIVFPWAGQAVMRSGWDADAHWSFFDVGPWGMAHQHNDKLHLSVRALGRDLLVDGGRYNYVEGPMRDYDVGSSAHNVILVDGHGQRPGVREADAPLSEDSYVLTQGFDYARGSFHDGFVDIDGAAVHTRAVLYVRDGFWVVVDRIETDRPRRIDALWHFHPECSVDIERNTVASNDREAGNLRVTPVAGRDWRISIVAGQETPHVQGWYSPHYNNRQPAPTATFSSRIERSETFAWVLTPARGRVPHVDASFVSSDDAGVRIRVRFDTPERPTVTVSVPLTAGAPDVSR